MTTTRDDVVIYSAGLVHCSVCVPAGMEREVIVAELNQLSPTGISSRWEISEESRPSAVVNPTHPRATPTAVGCTI